MGNAVLRSLAEMRDLFISQCPAGDFFTSRELQDCILSPPRALPAVSMPVWASRSGNAQARILIVQYGTGALSPSQPGPFGRVVSVRDI